MITTIIITALPLSTSATRRTSGVRGCLTATVTATSVEQKSTQLRYIALVDRLSGVQENTLPTLFKFVIIRRGYLRVGRHRVPPVTQKTMSTGLEILKTVKLVSDAISVV